MQATTKLPTRDQNVVPRADAGWWERGWLPIGGGSFSLDGKCGELFGPRQCEEGRHRPLGPMGFPLSHGGNAGSNPARDAMKFIYCIDIR
jgi:hypothetical protein